MTTDGCAKTFIFDSLIVGGDLHNSKDNARLILLLKKKVVIIVTQRIKI